MTLARAALCVVFLAMPLQKSWAGKAHVIVVNVDASGDLGWNGMPLSGWPALEYALQKMRREIPLPEFVIRGEAGADAETRRVATYVLGKGFKCRTSFGWNRQSGR